MTNHHDKEKHLYGETGDTVQQAAEGLCCANRRRVRAMALQLRAQLPIANSSGE